MRIEKSEHYNLFCPPATLDTWHLRAAISNLEFRISLDKVGAKGGVVNE
jgi:hypothetical protein